MDCKIAVEEHFAIDETLVDSRGVFPDDLWAEGKDRLTDLHGRRISLMDQLGIAMMLLSLNAPAIQAIPDAKAAGRMARLANDRLAEQVTKRPDASRRWPRCRCKTRSLPQLSWSAASGSAASRVRARGGRLTSKRWDC